MRILLVRQDKLGDNILATALPASIKRAAPNAEVGIMAQPCFRSIWDRHPDVSFCVPAVARPRVQHMPRMIADLLRAKVDAIAFLKRNSGEIIISSKLAGIKTRVGAAHKRYKRHLTVNRMSDYDRLMHEVDRGLRVAGTALGGIELSPEPLVFSPTPEEMDRAAQLTPCGYYVIHPTTGGTALPPDPEALAETAAWLSRQTGLKCVFTGGPGEVLPSPLAGMPDSVDLMGRLSLGEAAAVCRRAKLVVVGNTSMLHIAAAQQTPVLSLETRKSYKAGSVRWAPWQTPHITVLPENEAGQYQPLTAEMMQNGACSLLEQVMAVGR